MRQLKLVIPLSLFNILFVSNDSRWNAHVTFLDYNWWSHTGINMKTDTNIGNSININPTTYYYPVYSNFGLKQVYTIFPHAILQMPIIKLRNNIQPFFHFMNCYNKDFWATIKNQSSVYHFETCSILDKTGNCAIQWSKTGYDVQLSWEHDVLTFGKINDFLYHN